MGNAIFYRGKQYPSAVSGGSGGGGSGYEETVLLDNQTTVTSGSTLSLNDDYTKYDMIIIDASSSEYVDWRDFVVIDVSQIVLNEEHSRVLLRTSSALYGLRYKFTTITNLYAYGDGSRGITIYKIVGIKFGGGGGGSSETNYLTNEQRIGTWIDGKPLYQTTISTTTSSNSEEQQITLNDYGISNVDTVCKIEGVISSSDGWAQLNYFSTSSDKCVIYMASNNTKLIVSHYGSWTFSRPLYVTIRYTKTTD